MKLLRALLPWLLLAVLVGGGVGGYSYYQQLQTEQARAAEVAALRTEAIARGDLTARVSATGSILPTQQSSLFFAVPGLVVEVLVESGDAVSAGELLARVDAATLALAVQQAQAAVTVAQITRDQLLAGPRAGDVAVAEANLRAANARLVEASGGAADEEVAIAQLRYDNLLTGYQNLNNQYNTLVQFAADNPRFAPSPDTLASLKSSMEAAYFTAEVARLQLVQTQSGAGAGPVSVAYAQIVQARAVLSQTLAGVTPLQIEQAELSIAQAQTALDQAELRLSQTELHAPFSGIVGSVGVKVGEPAGTATPAVTLLDTTQFHLDVTVDEVDVAQLAPGQPVSVTLDALPGVALAGHVDRLGPTASTVGGLVSFSVRLALDDAHPDLRAGMSATADIVVAEAHGVVLAPNWAIRRDRRTGQAYVSLLQGGALVEAPITTGLRGETYTEVTSGVAAGDVAAVSTARDGLDLLGGG
ncbi:MAG: efflux RND transporter periplasmic adaptor subunit [Anaerolineales bacterium]|nr:efflux RND transporter periplasmic adaptor subunit [Anaerolineales bacterium]